MKLGKKRKLGPRYVGPFDRKQLVNTSYNMVFTPENFMRIHDVCCTLVLKVNDFTLIMILTSTIRVIV